jgi:hypothetical protein
MQPLSFTNLIEYVQHLPLDEKQALRELLENYLREERRNNIYNAYVEVKAVQDTLNFSRNIDDLKRCLDD